MCGPPFFFPRPRLKPTCISSPREHITAYHLHTLQIFRFFFFFRFNVHVIQTWVVIFVLLFFFFFDIEKSIFWFLFNVFSVQKMTVNQFTITVDSIIRSSLSPLSFFRTQQYHVNITSTINRTPATGIRILAKRGRGVPLKKWIRSLHTGDYW